MDGWERNGTQHAATMAIIYDYFCFLCFLLGPYNTRKVEYLTVAGIYNLQF